MPVLELFLGSNVDERDSLFDQFFYFFCSNLGHAAKLADLLARVVYPLALLAVRANLCLPMDASCRVRFLPLGGLGEIGMNCFALEQEGRVLVVDCGACFPDDDVGVDLIVPDFSWLLERESLIDGVFITHGHEDHIGALPHLVRSLKRPVPIYAPAHACALIAGRFAEQGIDHDCLHLVEVGQRYTVGAFEVEPIHVAHSIIDATALAIFTSAGVILHTADFNLDSEQPAGSPTDSQRLMEIGDEGVRLLLSDSTNIDAERREFTEGDVARELARLVSEAKQRVIIGMFSSNAHRMKALGEAARASGRYLCFLGRSLSRQHQVAQSLGALGFPSDLLRPPEALSELDRERVLVIAGGSQGEGPSALRRLSQGTHSDLEIAEGDTVILSARVIPGNEKAVFTMLGDFTRLGANVITRRECPAVHTSGHASRSELSQMIDWVRPAGFIPVHGTLHHLRKHAQLAREKGISDIAVVENGTSVEIDGSGRLTAGVAFSHGIVRLAWGYEVMSSRVRRRRGEMARRGVVFVSVVVDSQRNLKGAVCLTVLGVPGVDDDEGALSVVQSAVKTGLHKNREVRMTTLEDAIRRAVRAAIQEMCGARPLVEVHVSKSEV